MNRSTARVLKGGLIVVAAIWLLRVPIPLGLAWAHYRTTPDFRAWAAAHPVDDAAWRAALPAGETVASALPWRSEPDAAPSERRGRWLPRVEVRHGEETLLDLELDVAFETREVEGWEERGMRSEDHGATSVRLLRGDLDPDFHAVCVLSVRRPAADPGSPDAPRPGPELELDVFALSGPGELRVLVRDAGAQAFPGHGQAMLGRPLIGHLARRLLLGLVHPFGSAPGDGLAYHVRTRIWPTWTRVPGGSSGAGLGRWDLRASSAQYSVELRGSERVHAPWEPADFFGMSHTSEIASRYAWNGRVW